MMPISVAIDLYQTRKGEQNFKRKERDGPGGPSRGKGGSDLTNCSLHRENLETR